MGQNGSSPKRDCIFQSMMTLEKQNLNKILMMNLNVLTEQSKPKPSLRGKIIIRGKTDEIETEKSQQLKELVPQRNKLSR